MICESFSFSMVVNIRNSLPNWVVSANTTNTFKARLDKFWHNQDVCISPGISPGAAAP